MTHPSTNLLLLVQMTDPNPQSDRDAWLKLLKEKRNPFYEVPSTDQHLWRYMDFTKFVSMLETRSLFFPRANMMGDDLEGTVTQLTIDKRREAFKNADDQIAKAFEERGEKIPEEIRFRADIFEASIAEHLRWSTDWTYVSCWHMNEQESAAMWKLYAKSDEAIAVRTTFGQLEKCLDTLRCGPHGEPIVGKVKYIDFSEEHVSQGVHLSEFFYKRKSFEHERELRAVLQKLPIVGDADSGHYDKARPRIPGLALAMDPDELIDAIFVAPNAPGWFTALTRQVLARYSINKAVYQSGLNASPLY